MQIFLTILFAMLIVVGIGLFTYHITLIRRNINLGRDAYLKDNPGARWKQMAIVALGQSKMVKRRTLAGILHIFVYVGFIMVNIEVIEIIVDGFSGRHRFFGDILPSSIYNFIIIMAELFLLLVLVGTVAFLFRRNVQKVERFEHPELKGWPKLDANIILWTEIFLIVALLVMNSTDITLQQRGAPHYIEAGYFPVSQFFAPLWDGISTNTLMVIERVAWWAHIIGILAFLNYIPFSKHLHIFLSFPNTYYTPLRPMANFEVNENVKKEVQMMMDPNAAAAPPPEEEGDPPRFGAKDVQDLTWKNLLDAYTCTECGRCTASCPANITGKKLSPRKIMMDTRDRLHEVGKNVRENKGEFKEDGKDLHAYISQEELWACTTCQACYDACPLNINPMDIIVQMRQYLVMEQSQAPEALNAMFMNVENNQAPWAFPAADRANWMAGLEETNVDSENS
ncbi:MAG: 4Fe-4S dicluster domain-containing protein [Bacteroidota bacterium]